MRITHWFALLLCALVVLQAGCSSEQEATPETVAAQPIDNTSESLLIPFCANKQCGIFDDTGKVLMPLSPLYTEAYPIFLPNSVVFAKDNFYELYDPRIGRAILAEIDEIKWLLPNWYAFRVHDTYHLYSIKNKKLTPFLTTDPVVRVDVYAEQKLLVLEHTSGEYSVIDSNGQTIGRETFQQVVIPNGNTPYILGIKNSKNFLVFKDRPALENVPFTEVVNAHNGFATVMFPDFQWGLINETGALVLEPQVHPLVGFPSHDRIAFSEVQTGKCGYMNFQGKILIEARFQTCYAFGQSGAVAQSAESGLFGLIDRQGSWVLPAQWEDAAEAGTLASADQTSAFIPGLTAILKMQSVDGAQEPRYGLIDTNSNKVLFAPTNQLLVILDAILGKERWFFTRSSLMADDSVIQAQLLDQGKEVLLSDALLQNMVLVQGTDDASSFLLTELGKVMQVFQIESTVAEPNQLAAPARLELRQILPDQYPEQRIVVFPQFDRIIVYHYVGKNLVDESDGLADASSAVAVDEIARPAFNGTLLRTSVFTLKGVPIVRDEVDLTPEAIPKTCEIRRLIDAQGKTMWNYRNEMYSVCSK